MPENSGGRRRFFASEKRLPSPFLINKNSRSAAFWHNGQCCSVETEADYGEKPITPGEIVQPESDVPEKYFLTDAAKLEKFRYLRGAKKSNAFLPTGIPTFTRKAECRPTTI